MRRQRGLLTRELLGQTFTFHPMNRGEMSVVADVTRPVFQVQGRFDSDPGLEKLGGQNSQNGGHARLAVEPKMMTVPVVDLPHVPQTGDRVTGVIDGQTQNFEITRIGRDGNRIMIFYLSQI